MSFVKKISLLMGLLSVAALAMDENLVESGSLKLKIGGEKFDIPKNLVRARGGPFFEDLLRNPPKTSKIKMKISRNRIFLDCNYHEFRLAYIFIINGSLPSGYFKSTGIDAARFFSVPGMEAYIKTHPPKLSGHYRIDRDSKCHHCGHRFVGPLHASEHLIDLHNAQITTGYHIGNYWVASYRLPST